MPKVEQQVFDDAQTAIEGRLAELSGENESPRTELGRLRAETSQNRTQLETHIDARITQAQSANGSEFAGSRALNQ